MKRLILLFSVAILAILAPGCAIGRKIFPATPVLLRPAETNIVTLTKTNLVEVVQYQTNFVPVNTTIISNGVAVPATVPFPQVTATTSTVPVLSTQDFQRVFTAVYGTNYGVAPQVADGVHVAADASGLPWAGTAASTLLTLLASGAAWYSKRANDKLLAQKRTWVDTAIQLTRDIQTVRDGLTDPVQEKAIMDKVRDDQSAAGVKHAVEIALSGGPKDTVSPV